MTDMVNKYNTGIENLNAMPGNVNMTGLRKGLQAVDLAKIFGKRGVTCG
jgi:hypothetical protein